VLIWQAHKGCIESASFSRDGRYLATVTGGTRAIYLWDPSTGNLAHKLTGPGLGPVKSIAFAPHAPLMAVGTSRSVTVRNAETWDLVSHLDCPYAHELAFGPGKSPSLAASSANWVCLWTNASQPSDLIREPDRRIATRGNTANMHFSPDGKLLATSTPSRVYLWGPANGRLVRRLRFDREFRTGDPGNRGEVRFSPDGSRIAMVYRQWLEVRSLERKNDPPIRILAGIGLPGTVWAVRWTADGSQLLTVSSDEFVRVWNARTGAELRSLKWEIGRLYCVAFSPDGLTCAAGGEKGQVVVWDVDA
jgi:WD40 repeat protein